MDTQKVIEAATALIILALFGCLIIILIAYRQVIMFTTEQHIGTMKRMSTNHQEIIDFLQTKHLGNTNATSKLIGRQPRPLNDFEKRLEAMEAKISTEEVAPTAGDVEAIRKGMEELGSRVDMLEAKADKNHELQRKLALEKLFNHTPSKWDMED